MGSREAVARFWDEVINQFLEGGFPLPPPLDRWITAYEGAGEGLVDRDALPEPYSGPILGDARAVVLGLNPGIPFPEFQYRDGIIAKEIRACGSYREVVRTGFVNREPWLSRLGAVTYHTSRVRLMQRWNDDPTLGDEHLLTFELFPWHSKRIRGAMRPAPDIIEEMVFAPIAETGVRHVFAFGAEWFRVLDGLGMRRILTLGRGGEAYPTRKPSRTVTLFEGPGDFVVIAEKHEGSAGPPSASEIELLREALGKHGLGLRAPAMPDSRRMGSEVDGRHGTNRVTEGPSFQGGAMAEKVVLVCDVCGEPATESVTIKVGSRTRRKDLCDAHLAELTAGTRPARPGGPKTAGVELRGVSYRTVEEAAKARVPMHAIAEGFGLTVVEVQLVRIAAGLLPADSPMGKWNVVRHGRDVAKGRCKCNAETRRALSKLT